MSVDYETKTIAIATAAREFLTVVIGVALGYAIAVRGPEIPGLKTGSLSISSIEVYALLVYIIYASRFYINNWLYLSESYDEKYLKTLQLNEAGNRRKAQKLMFCCYLDLILSVYTAIVISLASIFGLSAAPNLNDGQWHNIAWWLMWCLLAHYLVDSIVLLITVSFSKSNTRLNKLRGNGWILNNLAFSGLFLLKSHDITYSCVLEMLFANCACAVFITFASPFVDWFLTWLDGDGQAAKEGELGKATSL